MSIGDIHALGLIAVIGATGVVIFRSRGNVSLSANRTLFAIATASLLAFLVLACNAHLCLSGNPTMQVIIPSTCIAAVLRFVRSKIERRLTFFLLLFAMLGMAFHYTELVHESDWTGNAGTSLRNLAVEIRFRHDLEEIADRLKDRVANDSQPQPEVWLRESKWADDLRDILTESGPSRVIIGRAWHSHLTHLYPTRSVSRDYWYPGGVLANALGQIRLKDRPGFRGE